MTVRAAITAAAAATRKATSGFVRAALAPSLVAALLALASGACAVAGVYLLAGTGWALIAAACVLLLLAVALAKGVTNG